MIPKNNNRQSLPIIGHLSSEKFLRGGERQCLLLHTELCKRGYSSFIICRNESRLSLQPFPFITTYRYKSIFDLRSLSITCKKLSLSILHCHDSKSFTLGSILKLLNPNLTLIYSRKVLFPIRNTLFNTLKFSRCTHIVAVSNAVAQVCSAIAPHTPLSIIHDSAQTETALLSRDEARLQLGLKQSDIGIGCVAFFTQEKNVELLLQCAALFEKTDPNVKFILIGPVEKSIELKLTNRKSIISTGHIHNAISLYNAFDIYLSTSVSEGLGSALLDAIYRDIPSVALDGGGTRDLFGQFGSPAANSDELIEQLKTIILHYTDAKQKASKRGEWARTVFTPEILVSKHIELYSSVVN